MKKLFDRLQTWLYLTGFLAIARVVGRWGTPPAAVSHYVHPPPPEREEPVVYTTDDHHPAIPLRIIHFDRSFNRNPGINMARDVAFPRTRLDVN